MEFLFSQLKQKDVINVADGKNLGRVCDITFTYPENKLLGITVGGGRIFKFFRQDEFIPMSSVIKIGEDAVLVKLGGKENCPPPKPPKRDNCPPPCPPDRRSYDEYE